MKLKLATSDPLPDTALPRVLVLTREIPQSVYAGSQQLFRVFKDYPADRLLVVGPEVPAGAERLPCRYETFVPRIDRWVNTRLHEWMNLANAIGVVPDESGRRIDQVVGDFRPDVVFTVMDLFSFYTTAWRYARKHRIPLVTLTMDDPMHFQKVAGWAKPLQKKAVKRIYDAARLSLGVSREMTSWIREEFGKPTETFYFGPPDGLRPREPETNKSLRNPPTLTVGFTGSLHFYGRELSRLLPGFEQAGARLHFYGTKTKDLPASPAVVDRGQWPIEKLWDIVQQECDALILPYPGNGWLENVFRTHFPTKLSEYLWQGLPLLITGPRYATGLRWGLDHPHACMALSEPSVAQVADILTRWRGDAAERVRMGEAAAAVACQDFDPGKIRQSFVRAIANAAEIRRPRH
jgi:glycosyltransferase involved in cell wall biosynthesis